MLIARQSARVCKHGRALLGGIQCRLFAALCRLLVLIVRWPGVARRPLTFFASPKKVSKERRPRCHWPSASQLCRTKNGKASKLASLKQRSFLYPFSVLHNWQCQKWNGVKVKSNSKAKTKTSSTDGIQFSNSSCRSLFLILLLTYPRLRRCNLCVTENG